LSEFFEPPPPAPTEGEAYRPPPWVAPPTGTLPGVLALELVLAQTDKVAVCLTRVAAYPTGFAFDVLTMAAPGQRDGQLLDPMMFGPNRHMRRGEPEMPPELLRLGVQFADGAKATNTSGFYHDTEPPAGPVMNSGGGGGGGTWNQSEWVWPLPPQGAVTFVCEWPAAGIPLTRHELDARAILDAAARAQVIFSDEHLPQRSGYEPAPPAGSTGSPAARQP
jgi:hypothetical protein